MSRRCARLIAVALATVLPALAFGCAARSTTVDEPEFVLSASQSLYREAVEESQAETSPITDVSMPPGVDAAALAPHDPADHDARVTLREAVETYAADGADERAAPIVETPTPEAAREALRHYIKGRDFATRDRFLVAVTELEMAEDLDPFDPAILRELARSYIGVGNNNKAVRLYERLLTLDPDQPEALFTLGMSASTRRDFARAVAMLGPGTLNPGAFDHDPAAEVLAAIAIADALRQLGHDRAAIEAYRYGLVRAGPIGQPTRYAAQYGLAYRRRGELWRAVGDAHCRLGEYEDGLLAYAESAALPTPDPAAVHPRAVYASFRLGRVRGAQAALLSRLADDPSAITDRDILLCSYVAEHAAPIELLSAAVLELYEQHPDEPGLARAAAALLPREEALDLLSGFVRRRPDDREVVAQLLDWLSRRDLESAVAFAVALCADHPERADLYARQLPDALPDPAAALDAVSTLEPSAAQTFVERTLRASLGDLGQAWSRCSEARGRWPGDLGLAMLQVRLAAELQEPALLAAAAESAAAFDDVAAWRGISRAWMTTGDTDRAIAAVAGIVREDPADDQSRLELARAQMTASTAADDESERREYAELAVVNADEVLVAQPDLDEAFDVLLAAYGPGGALESVSSYRQTAQRLFEANSESTLYRRLAAQESMSQRRFEDALERLLSLCRADPSDRQSLNLAILSWSGLDRLDEAQTWLEDRMEERPGDPALLEQWVRVLVRQDRAPDALEVLEARLAGDPGDAVARRLLESVYRALGRLDQVLYYGRQRLLERPPGVRRELDLAVLYADAGDPAAALERLQWFADHVEGATLEYLVRAFALTNRIDGMTNRIDGIDGIDELRLRLAEETISRFPAAPLRVYSGALASLVRLDAPASEVDAVVAAAIDTHARGNGSLEAAVSWLDLAQPLLDAGLPDEAGAVVRARLDRGAVLDPAAYGLLVRAAIATDAVADDAVDRTIGLIERLDDESALGMVVELAPQPTLADALHEVSIVYSILGNDEGGERLILEALRLNPDDSTLMNNLGYTRIENGRDDAQTVEFIERAIRLGPDDFNTLDTVGWLRYKQGRFGGDEDEDAALMLIRRAISLAETPSAEVYDHLGDTLWRLGAREEAMESWKQANGILDDPARRQALLRQYLLLQTLRWGLLVADPQELYDRDFGRLLERVRVKIKAVEQGDEPGLAPTFEEMTEGSYEGS